LETYSYSSSKAAVHHLTKVLANKLSEKKILVNAIAAGAFET
jgi:NAD(P)-dependent dehydrogenase (short-subunit alcohol dehydrogenase family)